MVFLYKKKVFTLSSKANAAKSCLVTFVDASSNFFIDILLLKNQKLKL